MTQSRKPLQPRLRRPPRRIGVDPERFHLIAPYDTDPRQWEKARWIDQYSGNRYRVTASGPLGSRTVARVKS